MNPAPRRRPYARLAVPALALSVGLLTGACSDETGSPSSGPESPETTETLVEPSDAPTLAVEPVTSIGRITGALPAKDARKVGDQVSQVATRWLGAAYLDGKYPRAKFQGAFPGFTSGARTVARRDIAVLTNDPIGGRVDQVTPTRMEIRVDLLAVDKRPIGATAHVFTTFETSGKVARRIRVAGRLMMTRRDGAWKVFAYRVSKGDK